MGTLENEILKLYNKLDKESQARIRKQLAKESASESAIDEAAEFDFVDWTGQIEKLRREIRADQGEFAFDADITDILRDIRAGNDE